MPHANSSETVVDHRAERDRFVAFAFAAADLLIEVGSDERIVYAAGATRALTGRDAPSLLGMRFRDLFTQEHRELARSLLLRVRREGRITPVLVELAREGKPALGVVLKGCRLPAKEETLYFTAALRPRAPEAADTAPRDEETGLLEGAAFNAAATAALNAAAAQSKSITLTLLDLAGIDELRARSGEGAVSDLLAEIGAFLGAHAVDGAAAGRIAADRFGVVRDGADAADLGGEIERLSKSRDRSGHGLRVQEQALPLAAGELSQIDAGRALAYTLGQFAAGGVGALEIRSLADGFRSMVADTVRRISSFRGALGEERVAIVYQPVVDLGERKTHHYEVLSRLGGDRSPAEMIKFAEGIGMIEELDLMVCRRALAQLDATRESADLQLAINLSGRSLQSDAFVAALARLLEPRADRERLLFEITETTAIADLARADRIVQDLRRRGHKVCLDDFGAGAASFPYLQALTVDFVKIDGAYVTRMLGATRDHAILKAIVALCRDLSTATIAEMIETEAQARRLAEIGVAFGQGFLFGRPAETPASSRASLGKIPPKTTQFARRKGFVASWG